MTDPNIPIPFPHPGQAPPLARPLHMGEPVNPADARMQATEAKIADLQRQLDAADAALAAIDQRRAAALAATVQPPPGPPMQPARPASVVDGVLAELPLRPGVANAIRETLQGRYGHLDHAAARSLIVRDLNADPASYFQPPPPPGPPPGSAQAIAALPEVAQQTATFGLTPLAPGQQAALPTLPAWSSPPPSQFDGSNMPHRPREDNAVRIVPLVEALMARVEAYGLNRPKF